MTREYTWGVNAGGGIGGLLNLQEAGTDYSYLYDGKGNVMAVLDPTQSVVAAYRYSPFGKLLTKSGTLDQPFTFSTKRYDENMGLNYYGFRYYNPAIGRWLTRDPLGEMKGLNLYEYNFNSPVNFVDPFGFQPINLPEDLSFNRLPDYITINLNVSILNLKTRKWVGYSGEIQLDRYGNVYVSPLLGANIGKSRLIPSISLSGGWLDECPKPLEQRLKDFLAGGSFNISGGYLFGGGISWVPNKGSATEIGISTPQFGGSYVYTFPAGNIGINW